MTILAIANLWDWGFEMGSSPKTVFAALFFACPLVSVSQAAEVEFRGAFCVTSITNACSLPGWVPGCHTNFRFSPRNLGDNGAKSRLSIFDGFLAQNYTMASGSPYGNTFRDVSGVRFGRGVAQFSSQWKITNQTPAPANLTAASAFVSFNGAITGFDNIDGCDITFKAAGVNGAIP